MLRLEKLIEQTSFLLEKQVEVNQECEQLFEDFLSFLKGKIDDFNSEPEQLEGLEKVYDMVSGHAQKLYGEVQDDIDFLREQLKALKEIAQVEDQSKAKELLSALIDDDEELPDTEEFKESVLCEGAEAKSGLLAMLDDIKEALREGDIEGVRLMLENALEGGDVELGGDFVEDARDEGGLPQQGGVNCCGSNGSEQDGCSNCSMGCGVDGGTDIFSMVNQYDKDLERDSEGKQGSKANSDGKEPSQ